MKERKTGSGLRMSDEGDYGFDIMLMSQTTSHWAFLLKKAMQSSL